MVETINPMSYEDLEKILKHLPEPNSLEVTLANFDYSDVHNQASKTAEKLEIKLDKIRYRSIDTEVLEPSKEKILRIYRNNREEDYKIKLANESWPKFISFKKAKWTTPNLRIKLDPFSVKVECTSELPDYIEKMREELKDTFVDYKIIQTPTLYGINFY